VEDGLLAEAMDDGKVTKALATARLREAKREGSDPDEIKALQHIIGLFETESAAKKASKEAQVALDLATLRQYAQLSEREIKQVVLDDKWAAAVNGRVSTELNALTLVLVARIQQLGQRYGETLEEIEGEVETLSSRVLQHLAAMGVE
jgi:type I restriction enzyme M protein